MRLVTGQEKVFRSSVREMIDKTSGKKFLAIAVPKSHLNTFNKSFTKSMRHQNPAEWSKKRHEFDGQQHRLTIVTPDEYALLSEKNLAVFLKTKANINYVLRCLGENENSIAKSCYVIANSPHIDYLRNKVGLTKRDLHVTMGYNPENVRDKPKDIETRQDLKKHRKTRSIYGRLT